MGQKYNRINAHETTFVAGAGIAYDEAEKNGSAHVGKAVMLTGDGEVDLVTTGLEVFGKLVKVEPDGYCTVQDQGYCDLPTDGTAITYTQDGLVGGATAGTVKSGTAAHCLAIASNGANSVIAMLR